MHILDISSPGDIFSGNPDTLKLEFRKLCLEYHPDANKSPTANAEFDHLEKLHGLALEHLSEGMWETRNRLTAKYRVKYRRKLDIGIGSMYVGDTHLTFLIRKEYRSLADNGLKQVNNFKYASNRMQEEISRYLPSIRAQAELKSYFVVVFHKTEDLILLRDIPIRTLPEYDRHVAWIVSTLHNLLCYFDYTEVVHNDISLDTYFISPKYHSGALLGGWWYSRPVGEKLITVPKSSYELFPPKMLKSLTADQSLDKELIRALGRELLGDRAGNKLVSTSPAPRPMIDWLRCATSKRAVDEYTIWNSQVLIESFGSKKYVPMNITVDMIYRKGD
jgi:hypothetical protein